MHISPAILGSRQGIGSLSFGNAGHICLRTLQTLITLSYIPSFLAGLYGASVTGFSYHNYPHLFEFGATGAVLTTVLALVVFGLLADWKYSVIRSYLLLPVAMAAGGFASLLVG